MWARWTTHYYAAYTIRIARMRLGPPDSDPSLGNNGTAAASSVSSEQIELGEAPSAAEAEAPAAETPLTGRLMSALSNLSNQVSQRFLGTPVIEETTVEEKGGGEGGGGVEMTSGGGGRRAAAVLR